MIIKCYVAMSRLERLFRRALGRGRQDRAPPTEIRGTGSAPILAVEQPLQGGFLRPESDTPFGDDTAVGHDAVVEADDPANECCTRRLWEVAYFRLMDENPDLVEAYERDLLALRMASEPEDDSDRSHSASEKIPSIDDTGEGRQENLRRLVHRKLESFRNAEREITLRGRKIIIQDQIRKVLSTVMPACDLIASMVSFDPYAAIVWAGIFGIMSVLASPIMQFDEALCGLQYIADLLIRCKLLEETHIQTMRSAKQSSESLSSVQAQLSNSMADLYTRVLKYQMQFALQYSRQPFFRLLRDCVAADNWRGMRANIKDIEMAISKTQAIVDSSVLSQANSRLSTLQDTMSRSFTLLQTSVQNIEELQLLSTPPTAKYAAFNSYKQNDPRPECLAGTRVEILAQIQKWGESQSDEYIYWLCGLAGTGKSTIARTVARYFKDRGHLGASFFFSRGREDLHNATKLFTTIAGQLAEAIPGLKPYICDAIRHYGKIGEQALCEQWRHLILQPMSKLNDTLRPLSGLIPVLSPVIVIDGLDECEDHGDIEEILMLLLEAKNLNMIRLRIFIASRPDPLIQVGFNSLPRNAYHDEVLQDVPKEHIQRDISIFLQQQLSKVRETHDLDRDWPGESLFQQLVLKADRLFIYAATACRFLHNDQFPQKRLQDMLEPTSSTNSTWKELDDIYMLIVSRSFVRGHDESNRDMARLFRKTVGSIIILFKGLTIPALSELLRISMAETKAALKPLHSVLIIPEDSGSPIQTFHLSFHDFLLDHERCLDPELWVDEKKAHEELFQDCLELMSRRLRKDICNLKQPGTPSASVGHDKVNSCISASVQYACRYWIAHLRSSCLSLHDDDEVHCFFRTHFLHWFEVLAFMGKTAEGLLALISLESSLSATTAPSFSAFVSDAKRFILHNRHVIEEAPLQIYCSALIFTPERSVIRRHFHDQIPAWFQKLPNVPKTWGSLEQVLEGHLDAVTCVAFSPDGSQLASGSNDRTIRIWNTSTGKAERTLEGHSQFVSCIAFSPTDGACLVSGSGDTNIRIWNVAAGQTKHNLRGHASPIACVSFAPDGNKLFSESIDGNVRVWCPTTGRLCQSYEGDCGWSQSAAFSPDGSQLATGLVNGGIQIRAVGAQAGRDVHGHSDWVRAVTYSPDGNRLASGSLDHTVRVWNNTFGAAVDGTSRKLEGHSSTVISVAFSPDGTRIASGSHDKTVKVWDVTTASLLLDLTGHSDPVNCVAFSPDGQKLVSGSDGRIVRIWDVSSLDSDVTCSSHDAAVSCIALSPCGGLLATGSIDSNIRIWNMRSGQVNRVLRGHTDVVNSVAFSRNNSRLGSGSCDRTVRVWDISAGAALWTLEGHSDWIWGIAFSPDDKTLAWGSDDRKVRLSDLSAEKPEKVLEGHQYPVNYLVFSSDGARLASGSGDRTARVWNTTTGAVEHIFQDHTDRVSCIAFSPNGRLVVGSGHNVWVWNLETGQVENKIDGYYYWVEGIARSLESGSAGGGSSLYSVEGPWITLGGRGLLHLPLEYRPGIVAIDGSSVVVGAESGLVAITTFRSDVEVGIFHD